MVGTKKRQPQYCEICGDKIFPSDDIVSDGDRAAHEDCYEFAKDPRNR